MFTESSSLIYYMFRYWPIKSDDYASLFGKIGIIGIQIRSMDLYCLASRIVQVPGK
jgi:hypothetical protein